MSRRIGFGGLVECFVGFWVGEEDRVRLLQVGTLYVGSFNQSGDTLCLRPVPVCVHTSTEQK